MKGLASKAATHQPTPDRPRFAASHPHANTSATQTMAMNIPSPIVGMDRNKAISDRSQEAAKTAPQKPPGHTKMAPELEHNGQEGMQARTLQRGQKRQKGLAQLS
ncbi:hypothetical protein [Comamonas sp. CMM01]|nr:hypothetical protein [Comamonas sp. CMM01]